MGFSEAALSQVMLEAASRARIGVVVTHRQGEVLRTVYASPVAAELLRSTSAALVSGDARFLVTDPYRAEALRISAAVRAGQSVPMPFEMEVLRTDGTAFAAELAVTPVIVEGDTYMVSFFWSVEARRAAEEHARTMDALYRGLIESAPDGVVISRDGRVLWANAAAAKILALPGPEAMVGTLLYGMLRGSGEAVMRERVAAMQTSGSRPEPREYRAQRADGSQVVVEVRAIPFQWEGAPAVMASVRDVTLRLQMEARLAQTDRLTALGTLAAGVAHEINNPMAAVIFGIEGVERMLRRPVLDEKARADLLGLLGDLRKGAERVTRIVRDLRVFSRGGDETVGPVELRQVVEAADRIAGHAVRARASLVIALEGLPLVRGNVARLEQVVVNLLVNAAQAMPAGRDVALNRVQVKGRIEPSHVVLEVQDNGRGIPPSALPHIFEPFFTTKPVDEGTGLGLSICHGILKQLGGELSVASTGEEGTTLAVRLLRADP